MKTFLVAALLTSSLAAAKEYSVNRLLDHAIKQKLLSSYQTPASDQIVELPSGVFRYEAFVQDSKNRTQRVWLHFKTKPGTRVVNAVSFEIENALADLTKEDAYRRGTQLGSAKLLLNALARACFGYSEQTFRSIDHFFYSSLQDYSHLAKNGLYAQNYAWIMVHFEIENPTIRASITAQQLIKPDHCVFS